MQHGAARRMQSTESPDTHKNAPELRANCAAGGYTPLPGGRQPSMRLSHSKLATQHGLLRDARARHARARRCTSPVLCASQATRKHGYASSSSSDVDHLNAWGKMMGASSVLILSKRKMAQNCRKTLHGIPACAAHARMRSRRSEAALGATRRTRMGWSRTMEALPLPHCGGGGGDIAVATLRRRARWRTCPE